VLLAGGTRVGYNTDVPGMVTALGAARVALDGPVLMLGGGATACSAIAALRRAGAATAVVAVRDQATAGPLLEVAAGLGVRVRLVPFGPGPGRPEWLAEYRGRPWALLLSTVPAGAADGYADLIAAGELAASAVFDVVYHPWPTRLAAAADSAGMPVIGGFELLLHQAAEQFRLMTGRPAPVQAMRAAGLAELTARSHPN
jgi:shikimate dehydrogenase